MAKLQPLHILGVNIEPGKTEELSFKVAKLHTQNSIDIPVIINRSKKPGPTVLITAGIHGDEVNGVEIVRQIIAKGINKPKKGTIICIPLINVFGFIQMNRVFPDGRDLNRVFPGSANGSLASRVAHQLMTEIVPYADLVLDFHTGGASRFNAPQVRIVEEEHNLKKLAQIFGPPFILYSKNLNKSFRNSCYKLNIPILLFEGGKSFHIDPVVTNSAVNGIKRILANLGMLNKNFKASVPKKESVFIAQSSWLRANYSGLFKASITIGSYVKAEEVLGNITDPYGKFNHFVRATQSGYILNVNHSPIVYQGDALFHISIALDHEQTTATPEIQT